MSDLYPETIEEFERVVVSAIRGAIPAQIAREAFAELIRLRQPDDDDDGAAESREAQYTAWEVLDGPSGR